MRRNHIRGVLGILLLASLWGLGCGKNGDDKPNGGTDPCKDFPPSTDLKIALHTSATEIAHGQDFEIKVILYNPPSAFGLAFEIDYPTDLVEVTNAAGSSCFSALTTLSVIKYAETPGRVGYGMTLLRGDPAAIQSSGIVVRLACRAKNAGTGSISFDPEKLVLSRSDGSMIDGLDHSGLTLTIR